jgi:hypothetical protein
VNPLESTLPSGRAELGPAPVMGLDRPLPANGLIIVPTQIIDKSNVEGFIQQVKMWLGH